MDDLTRCLYEFVCEKRLGSLYIDKEYQETVQNIEHWRAQVETYLDKEQKRALELLIYHAAAQRDIEREHLFRAALSLSRELNGLVSYSCRKP